eukprot:7094131-Pyramimonas_sp.AAC.1
MAPLASARCFGVRAVLATSPRKGFLPQFGQEVCVPLSEFGQVSGEWTLQAEMDPRDEPSTLSVAD